MRILELQAQALQRDDMKGYGIYEKRVGEPDKIQG